MLRLVYSEERYVTSKDLCVVSFQKLVSVSLQSIDFKTWHQQMVTTISIITEHELDLYQLVLEIQVNWYREKRRIMLVISDLTGVGHELEYL